MAIVTDLLGRGLRGIFLPYAPPLVAFNISPFAISNFPTNTKVDQGLSVYTGSTMVLRFHISSRLGSVYSISSIWLWRLHPILGVVRRDETWSGLYGPFSTGQLLFKDWALSEPPFHLTIVGPVKRGLGFGLESNRENGVGKLIPWLPWGFLHIDISL